MFQRIIPAISQTGFCSAFSKDYPPCVGSTKSNRFIGDFIWRLLFFLYISANSKAKLGSVLSVKTWLRHLVPNQRNVSVKFSSNDCWSKSHFVFFFVKSNTKTARQLSAAPHLFTHSNISLQISGARVSANRTRLSSVLHCARGQKGVEMKAIPVNN